MPAPIVYDGVEAQGAASEVGGLFQGQKFWVATRVPMRTHFVMAITVLILP